MGAESVSQQGCTAYSRISDGSRVISPGAPRALQSSYQPRSLSPLEQRTQQDQEWEAYTLSLYPVVTYIIYSGAPPLVARSEIDSSHYRTPQALSPAATWNLPPVSPSMMCWPSSPMSGKPSFTTPQTTSPRSGGRERGPPPLQAHRHGYFDYRLSINATTVMFQRSITYRDLPTPLKMTVAASGI
jgi:hypothetical protein